MATTRSRGRVLQPDQQRNRRVGEVRHGLASEADQARTQRVAAVLQLAHVAEPVQRAEQAMRGGHGEVGVGCQGRQRALSIGYGERLQQCERSRNGLE